MIIEKYNNADEFHCAINRCNLSNGVGRVEGIVWNSRGRQNLYSTGLVLVQLQYGLKTREFAVEKMHNGYRLSFLNRYSFHPSDYFKEKVNA